MLVLDSPGNVCCQCVGFVMYKETCDCWFVLYELEVNVGDSCTEHSQKVKLNI